MLSNFVEPAVIETKTELKNIIPNPWRDVENFEYSSAKLQALAQSYERTGFYGVFVVRQNADGWYELLGQHHRHRAAVLFYGSSYSVSIQVRELSDEEMLSALVDSDDHIYASTPSSVLGTITRMIERGEQKGYNSTAIIAEIGNTFGWRKPATKTRSTGSKADIFYRIAVELRKPDSRLSRQVFNILPNLETAIQFFKQVKAQFWDRFLILPADRQIKVAKAAAQDSTQSALNIPTLLITEYRKIAGDSQADDAVVEIAKNLLENIARSLRGVKTAYGRLSTVLTEQSKSRESYEKICDAYARKNIKSEFLKVRDKIEDLEKSLRLKD
jgi:hypothetical protein